MIHGYAIDPELIPKLCSRPAMRAFLAEFGLGRPRVPVDVIKHSKWVKKVHLAAGEAGLSQQEKQLLCALIAALKPRGRRVVTTGAIPGDQHAETWMGRAKAAKISSEYAGILSHQSMGDTGVLGWFDMALDDARWCQPRGVVAQRTPEAFAEVLGPLLRNSGRIHIVDPYWNSNNARHQGMFLACAHRAATVQRREAVQFTIHCNDDKGAGFLIEAMDEWVTPNLPDAAEVRLWQWPHDAMHNRYVLTELGGVTLGEGLGAGERSDDLNLMGKKQYMDRWGQFVHGEWANVEPVAKLGPFSKN